MIRFLLVTLILSSLIDTSRGAEVALPSSMAWTAYNLGTTGYNQAVAIGKVLKDRYGVTLRVIPGKNDISRLLPLKQGRVQFSANGVATYFAQEGVFQFADVDWGPMPVRVVMMSNGLSNQAVAVAADSGIKTLSDLKGKRVPWVRGAPALNISTEAIMACGGVTWRDVERVDYPGYNAMWNGIVDGQVDAAYATTVSGPTRKLEASPRGIFWPSVPHDDKACWDRLLSVAPYFRPHIATRGAGISKENPHEGATYPYPVLIALQHQKAELVHDLTSVIHENYDAFKGADPGAIGWAMEFQQFDWVVPFHEGSVKYFKEIGVWSDKAEINNQRLIERQDVLADAWQAMLTLGINDDDEFRDTWLRLRALRLEEAGFDPVWD
ncbi:MAG: TAXI family TRAP transporter solute-binding subunit [Pseudomonadales bacterium]|nr:TAXI family TRAP transporter solute-binding subunit [Pseudomonadales bacterium]